MGLMLDDVCVCRFYMQRSRISVLRWQGMTKLDPLFTGVKFWTAIDAWSHRLEIRRIKKKWTQLVATGCFHWFVPLACVSFGGREFLQCLDTRNMLKIMCFGRISMSAARCYFDSNACGHEVHRIKK